MDSVALAIVVFEIAQVTLGLLTLFSVAQYLPPRTARHRRLETAANLAPCIGYLLVLHTGLDLARSAPWLFYAEVAAIHVLVLPPYTRYSTMAHRWRARRR